VDPSQKFGGQGHRSLGGDPSIRQRSSAYGLLNTENFGKSILYFFSLFKSRRHAKLLICYKCFGILNINNIKEGEKLK